jgi:hypothetical protein
MPARFRAQCIACERKWDHDYRNANRSIVRNRARIGYAKDPVKTLFELAAGRARKNHLEFNLDLPFLRELWNSTKGCCAVSGLPFEMNIGTMGRGHAAPFRPSLDRIDNNCGYTKGNVRFVLWAVNRAISNYGLDMFLSIARAIVDHQSKP